MEKVSHQRNEIRREPPSSVLREQTATVGVAGVSRTTWTPEELCKGFVGRSLAVEVIAIVNEAASHSNASVCVDWGHFVRHRASSKQKRIPDAVTPFVPNFTSGVRPHTCFRSRVGGAQNPAPPK